MNVKVRKYEIMDCKLRSKIIGNNLVSTFFLKQNSKDSWVNGQIQHFV